MLIPEKIGERRILVPPKFGKTMISQEFRSPVNGEAYEYILWHGDGRPVIILPVTREGEVVAIRKFSHPMNSVVLEIPGGNQEEDDLPEDAVRRELEEETGYQPEKVLLISPNRIIMDSASHTGSYPCYLALDCRKTREPDSGAGEYIEVGLIPFARWFRMIWSGEITDSKTIVLTHLALPHLGVTLQFPEERRQE